MGRANIRHEIYDTVLGYNRIDGAQGLRTPLHVDFSDKRYVVKPEVLHAGDDLSDLERFNAIGSRVLNRTVHLPLIESYYGLGVHPERNGRRAVLISGGGTYSPHSLFKDVLDDMGIELEVFKTQVRAEHTKGAEEVDFTKFPLTVGAIVLRTSVEGTFVLTPPSTEGHGHLYIQKAVSDEGHTELINGLEELGVISKNWAGLTREAKMGILRTPWTVKDPAIS